MAFDPTYYGQANPDVLQEYYKVNGAGLGPALGLGPGALTPEQFLQYHYNEFGQREGRPGSAPVAPPPPSPSPVVPNTPAPGAVGDPNDTLAAALAKQRMGLYAAAGGLGIDPGSVSWQFDSYLNQMAGFIPAGATHFSSYFDPNLASSWLNGQNSAVRSQATHNAGSTFNPNFANSKISDSFLDQTINDILDQQYKEAQTAFDRGKARGQFNDAGFSAGIGALDQAKT